MGTFIPDPLGYSPQMNNFGSATDQRIILSLTMRRYHNNCGAGKEIDMCLYN